MQAVFEQTLILFVFIFIGYALAKFKLLPGSASLVLSKLLVYVFLPSLTFNTFATNFNVNKISEHGDILLIATITMIIMIPVAKLIARALTQDKLEQGIYSYTLTTPNYGYMGYALMTALYGDEMLMKMMIFTLPISVYTYTEGFRVLTGKEKITLKNIVNPLFASLFAGAVFGLSGFAMPAVISTVLAKSSACMAPTSMILTGIVLAGFSLRETLANGKVYFVSFLRLIAIPLAVYFSVRLFTSDKTSLIVAVLTFSMPAGLNTIIFPNLSGANCKTGSSLITVANILSLATIPILFAVLNLY